MTKFYELSEDNQPVWDNFAKIRLAEIIDRQKERGEVNEKSAAINLAQYKEAAILLDGICPDFSKLTVKNIDKAKAEKPQKANHINGLLITAYNADWINLSADVVISLIPSEYRLAVSKAIKND